MESKLKNPDAGDTYSRLRAGDLFCVDRFGEIGRRVFERVVAIALFYLPTELCRTPHPPAERAQTSGGAQMG